jgi:isocitrate dehydrogenase kinase/phosphatase
MYVCARGIFSHVCAKVQIPASPTCYLLRAQERKHERCEYTRRGISKQTNLMCMRKHFAFMTEVEIDISQRIKAPGIQ